MSYKDVSIRAEVSVTVGWVEFEFDGVLVHTSNMIPCTIVSASSRLAKQILVLATLISLSSASHLHCIASSLIFFYCFIQLFPSKNGFTPQGNYRVFNDIEMEFGHTIGVKTFASDGTPLDYLLIDVTTPKFLAKYEPA
jgi:hypothetical protein